MNLISGTMNIKINGKNYEYEGSLTLQQLVERESINPVFVVIEMNKVVVKKELWKSTPLNDGDSLEVVSFVGGG